MTGGISALARHLRAVLLIGLSLMALTCATAPAVPRESPVILSIATTPRLEMNPGDSAIVKLSLRIARGFHVNANPPASDDYLPLEIFLPDSMGVTFGKPAYPQGKKFRLSGTDEDLLVYDGAVDIRLPLRLSSTAKTGTITVKGEISYQACDDEVCWLPDTLPLAIVIAVNRK